MVRFVRSVDTSLMVHGGLPPSFVMTTGFPNQSASVAVLEARFFGSRDSARI